MYKVLIIALVINIYIQLYDVNVRIQPQDSMDEFIDAHGVVIKQRSKLDCKANQDLFQELLDKQIYKQEDNGILYKHVIGGKTYTFKIELLESLEKNYLKEAYLRKEIMRRATKYIGDEFVNYYDCYLGQNDNQLYLISKFEDFSKSLSYKKQSNNATGFYFGQLIKGKDRLKLYRDLFQALETLQEKGYVHKNIHPKNMLTKFPIQEYSQINKNTFKIKFGDYSQCGKISGDNSTTLIPHYIHPQYIINNEQMQNEMLDVFALTISLLEIASYKQGEISHSEFFGNYMNSFDRVFALNNKNSLYNYLKSEFEGFRTRAIQMMNITNEQIQFLDHWLGICFHLHSEPDKLDKLQECLAKYISEGCKKNLECAFYVQLSWKIQKVMTAETMKKILNEMKNNFNAQLV